MKCSPQDGGCWYCHTDNQPLAFCCEFDTFIHIDCIKKEIKLTKEYNPELEFIRKEFGL